MESFLPKTSLLLNALRKKMILMKKDLIDIIAPPFAITITVQVDVIAAPTDLHKQTTYCLNTLTNITCLVDAGKKGKEQYPIQINKPLSNKQPSLISSTRKIERSKKAKHTQVSSAGLFFKREIEEPYNKHIYVRHLKIFFPFKLK